MAEVSGSMPKPQPVQSAAATQKPAAGDPSKTADSIKVVGAPFRIQPLQSADQWLKALFYAAHGVGKTELAGSAADVPEMEDVIFISAEKGTATLSTSPRIKRADSIDVIPVTTFKQVAQICEFLKSHCKFRDQNNMDSLKKLQFQVFGEDLDRVRKYKTVVIDSLTEVETYCQYGILGIDSLKIEADGIETSGWPEFRKNLEMVKLLVRAFRDLPMHVIFICSESYSQDEMKKYHYTPQLTGQLSKQVQGFVDIVGWLTTGSATEEKEAPRRIYLQTITGPGIPRFDAKNRRAIFGKSYIDDPNMASLMKATGFIKA